MKKCPFALATLAAILLAILTVGCGTDIGAQSPIEILTESDPSANCPVTTPGPYPFEPAIRGLPTEPFDGEFWHGTKHLWTSLPLNGTWTDLPHNPDGYTQKIFWWSEFYPLTDEHEPPLFVSGRRLDGDAPLLIVSKATNASGSDIGSAMLVGVDFPTAGCWEITGQYKKSGLTFVIRVKP